MIRRIDAALLAQLTQKARQSPRRRQNCNFHPDDDFPAHRLLNAIEPGSYIVPHRHLACDKDEALIALSGRLGVVFFDDDGGIAATLALAPAGAAMGVDIPHGVWHTLLALAPGSVLFEAKAGPYRPLAEGEKAPWAPPEQAPEARAYLARLAQLFAPD